jgi:hypothetical protein|nr:MAG TPA: hypothetical protein [Caudoviricetes sp.]
MKYPPPIPARRVYFSALVFLLLNVVKFRRKGVESDEQERM